MHIEKSSMQSVKQIYIKAHFVFILKMIEKEMN
jgi:hypothetical protein